MPHQISISDETFARMQSLAIPLVDTPDSVILRALHALDREGRDPMRCGHDRVRSFNPAAPPSLSHTTLKSASIGVTKLEKAETSWNSLMIAAIRELYRRGRRGPQLCDHLRVNSVEGRRDDSGYKFIEDLGISVQGQDANSAWRQSYDIASGFGIAVEAEFAWHQNPKAAMPGVIGRFSVGASL